MAWLAVVLAGCAEIFGVINIKRMTEKKWDAALYLIIGFGVSLSLLSYAMKTIPMGTVYAVWTGIGTVGATLLGMFVYGEPKDWRRIFCIALDYCFGCGVEGYFVKKGVATFKNVVLHPLILFNTTLYKLQILPNNINVT